MILKNMFNGFLRHCIEGVVSEIGEDCHPDALKRKLFLINFFAKAAGMGADLDGPISSATRYCMAYKAKCLLDTIAELRLFKSIEALRGRLEDAASLAGKEAVLEYYEKELAGHLATLDRFYVILKEAGIPEHLVETVRLLCDGVRAGGEKFPSEQMFVEVMQGVDAGIKLVLEGERNGLEIAFN